MNIHTINNSNSNGNSSGQQSCKDKMKAFWDTIPIFVRIVITLTITFYILSWFLSAINILVNKPFYTIYSLRIWTLFTSVFMTLNLLNILFAFMSWVPDAIKLESTTGTVRYMLNFLTNSFMIQFIYVLLVYLLSFIFGKAFLNDPRQASAGLWPLIMAEITILCTANPDNEVRMFLVPVPVQSKYYPWALYAFFTLLNFHIQFDLLAAILYGYLFFYKLRNIIQFSDEFIIKCENFCLFRYLSKFKGKLIISQVSIR